MKKITRYTLILFTGAIFIFFLGIGLIYSILYMEVRKNCDFSENLYKRDCVDSLLQVLKSDQTSYKEKNDAIWTLGQIADVRALPLLKSMYVGNIPPREPLDKTISQYEIKKAIGWIENGNWTSWMYWQYK